MPEKGLSHHGLTDGADILVPDPAPRLTLADTAPQSINPRYVTRRGTAGMTWQWALRRAKAREKKNLVIPGAALSFSHASFCRQQERGAGSSYQSGACSRSPCFK